MVDSKENYKFDLGVKGSNTPGWSFFFADIDECKQDKCRNGATCKVILIIYFVDTINNTSQLYCEIILILTL